jgi:LL-diaminopimelate aminotransferase
MKCPDNMTSWEYFDYLLESTGIITLPGSEFGKNGEGYVRLSSLAKREDIVEGMRRFIAID